MTTLAAMCRVCLAVDVRLLTIAGSLQRVYEKLTDTALHTADGRPAAACYICYAQLNKCHKLMVTSARAETLLNAILFEEIAVDTGCGIGLLGSLRVSGCQYFETQEPAAVVIKHEPETEVPDSEIRDRSSQDMCYSGPSSAAAADLHDTECCSDEDDPGALSQLAGTQLDIKQELELEEGPPSAAAADLHDTECGSDEDYPGALSQPAVIQVDIKQELVLEEDVAPAGTPGADKKQAKGSTTNSKQRESQRESTTRTAPGPHQCEVCQRRFKRPSEMIRHYRIHTGEKPFQCKVCDSRFNRKSHLLTHNRTHTGEKPFQCNMCDSRFNQKSILLKHIRIHTGEKPFQCNVCDSRFNRKCHLLSHIRTHTGEKPYECNVCQKRFSESSNLRKHLRTHTGEKKQCVKRS